MPLRKRLTRKLNPGDLVALRKSVIINVKPFTVMPEGAVGLVLKRRGLKRNEDYRVRFPNGVDRWVEHVCLCEATAQA